MATYTEKKFKSILIVRKFVDSWFWEKYAINAYNGCQHGCIYCDSRSAKYHLPTDFENEIVVKTQVKEMLRSRLSKARSLLPDVVGMSGASDPYHAAEIIYKNTRTCLEVLNEFQFPVHILTKSKLVLRDLDLFSQIANNNWATVSFTITTTDKKISRFLEPYAPSPDTRFAAIENIKKENNKIQSGVLLMPVIPCLTDSRDLLEDLIKRASHSGADYVMFSSGMTMRDVQATWFLNKLNDKHPQLIQAYEKMYQFKYDPNNYSGNYTTTYEYSKSKNELLLELCEKNNMPYRIKRYVPKDYRKTNYLIAETILNKAFDKQITGQSYSDWQWAGVNIQHLKKPISELYLKNNLKELHIKSTAIMSAVIAEIKKLLPQENTSIQLGLFD